MKKILLYLTSLSSIICWSQAPNISYPSGTNTYSTNIAITALSPTNIGGSVPSIFYYGQIIPISGNPGSGLTIDTSGNLYVANDNNHKINKITPAGVYTTLAGTGVAGSSSGSQTLNNAQFNYPNDVVTDSAGKFYVAQNSWFTTISTITGYVSPYAGGVLGIGFADGSNGTNSKFYLPKGLVLDDFGNIYVADSGNNKIRKISVTNNATCGGLCMYSGPVTTIAGDGSLGSTDGIGSLASFKSPNNLVLDAIGNIFVADTNNNKIRKISPAGVVSTFAGSGIAGLTDGVATVATFNKPYGLALDATGNMYVADYGNNKIRKITPTGIVTTVTSICQPTDICIDSSDNIYFSSYCSGIGKIKVTGYSISPTTLPAGLTFDGTTGVISGTPTASSPATTYTIKAFNSSGSSTATVIIQTFTAPTGSASQTLCAGSKLANIAVVGSNIKWYSNSAGGSSLSSTLLLTNGTTYYASQTINGIESFNRLAVTITITTLPPPTTGLTVQSLAGLTVSTIQVNTYPYSSNSVRWYANQSDAINHINPLPNTTILVNGNTYYATINDSICESITSLAVLINSNPIIDIDGNAYNIIDVCNQKWTQTNLNVSKYSDGTPIPQVTDPSAWANLYTGAWCYYNNDPANGAIYGKLYNGYAVAGVHDAASLNNPGLRKSLAPNGCHIPSEAEWDTLTSCLGGQSVAGGKMKEAGTTHWSNPNTAADNTSRFTAFPAGGRGSNYYLGISTFSGITNSCGFWNTSFVPLGTGSGYVMANQVIRWLNSNSATLDKNYQYIYPTHGLSVRLINDLALSTQNNNYSKKIVLYPNPTHSVISLSINDEIVLDKVAIIDITGKVILEQTENLSTINVEKLAKGVYILTAYAGDQKYQEKFIKE